MTNVVGLARTRTELRGPALAHIERLVATWRPLADLSFSDLVLVAPISGEDGHRFVVLAMCGSALLAALLQPADEGLILEAGDLGKLRPGKPTLVVLLQQLPAPLRRAAHSPALIRLQNLCSALTTIHTTDAMTDGDL